MLTTRFNHLVNSASRTRILAALSASLLVEERVAKPKDDLENGDKHSPPALQRTMVRPADTFISAETQTFNDHDRKRVSEVVADRPPVDGAAVDAQDSPPTHAAIAPGSATQTATGAVPPLPPAAGAHTKYELLGLIGRGGMGDVFEVKDTALTRQVALKRLRAEVTTPQSKKMFLQEAKVTAQLEHPNVVPVHESGMLETGEAYFTMKRLRGSSLREVLNGLARGDAQMTARFPRVRVGILFLEMVRAVGYAHARGVVHCDLKPGNILIGEHGEVAVSDWGLARKDPLPPPREGALPVHFPEDGPDTLGIISGTVPYMAPEQAHGVMVDRRADVYSLGAILYELLTLQPAYPARGLDELLRQFGGVIPPRRRAPQREISEEIEAVCMRCLEQTPKKRFDSALDLQVAVEDWLTGTRRRVQAEEAFHAGEAARARLEALRVEAGQLQQELARLERSIKPFDGEAKKAPLWAVEERVVRAALDEEEALAAAIDAYGRATSIDASFVAPQDQLADLHLALFLDAEARGRKLEEQLHRRQVERFHRGRHAQVLDGKGTLTLAPVQRAVSVRGWRIVERGKRMVRDESIATAPLSGAVLPSGSYLFELEGPELCAARVHVLLGRGTELRLEPRLFPVTEVGEDFVHVPAGPYVAGGDETALNSEARVARALPDYFIARYPVTCAQYCAFLNDLAAESPHLARQHVPRTKPEGGALWEQSADGRYALPNRDADGNPVHPDAPVMGVSFYDAEMFAAHQAKKTGLRLRLPTEEEWEKAARGADGRFFPWGNGFDPSFCKMALSRPGRPQPEPVGSFPVDESPYGMRDAAGGIREWTDSFFDRAQETRTLRGGAWYFNPHYCRLAFRHGYLPHIVFTNFGFRLAKSAPG